MATHQMPVHEEPTHFFLQKKSHLSRYLKRSLLTSLYRFIHQDARRLLMSDLFVEKVSRFLMSRHLMSSHLKKKMRWLLMRCLLTTTWTGLLTACSLGFKGTLMLFSRHNNVLIRYLAFVEGTVSIFLAFYISIIFTYIWQLFSAVFILVLLHYS